MMWIKRLPYGLLPNTHLHLARELQFSNQRLKFLGSKYHRVHGAYSTVYIGNRLDLTYDSLLPHKLTYSRGACNNIQDRGYSPHRLDLAMTHQICFEFFTAVIRFMFIWQQREFYVAYTLYIWICV